MITCRSISIVYPLLLHMDFAWFYSQPNMKKIPINKLSRICQYLKIYSKKVHHKNRLSKSLVDHYDAILKRPLRIEKD